ncbi:MAG TPA: DUF4173 domain-containing protein, partial [Candidatus Dormibacteraeota bacterium]
LWRWDGTAWRPVSEAPLPAWSSVKLRSNATWAAVVAALLVGLAADQALRNGRFGLAASTTFIGAAFALVWVGRLERLESRLLAGAAVLFAGALTLRASPWLLLPDLFAAIGLLGVAASLAVRGSLYDLGVADVAARSFHAFIQLAVGVAFVARPVIRVRGRVSSAIPFARGVLIAAPIALLLGGLLASADPVFASFFNLNIDVGQLILDVLFVLIGSLAAAGLLRLAASEPIDRVDGPTWRLGATEALVVLAVLDAVFAAFALAQVLAASGAAAETLRSAGVTYSDYARSGFFQLLWVSGITLALLIFFSRISAFKERSSRLAFLVLAECAIALTLMVDVVAFRRLSLYEEAYGFTMLRLYSHVFAVWLGVVFGLLAADFLGVFRQRRWFIGATVTTALVVLLGLNVANPEAIVVALNTSHAQVAHKIDGQYLSELSSDATPALLASRANLEPALQQQITQAACAGPRGYVPPLAAFNLADAQAAEARRSSC